MDELTILRTLAAVTTVLAASLVAANLNARITVADRAASGRDRFFAADAFEAAR